MSLKDFINTKKQELKILKRTMPLSELKKKLKNLNETRNFLNPFKKGFTLIAEIKKASPSEGIISKDEDLIKIAKQYEAGGAGVISVLTDKKFFNGDINALAEIKKAVSLPILRKDFIIDEYQIYESKVYGADAILLIAGALSKQKLKRFIDLSYSLGIECLIEIHNKKELNKIPKNARIIGVNNRNLDTLKTDLSIIENLIDKIPQDKIIISESGIKNRDDVERIKKLNVKGILTGTSLMKSKNKIETIKNLLV